MTTDDQAIDYTQRDPAFFAERDRFTRNAAEAVVPMLMEACRPRWCSSVRPSPIRAASVVRLGMLRRIVGQRHEDHRTQIGDPRIRDQIEARPDCFRHLDEAVHAGVKPE